MCTRSQYCHGRSCGDCLRWGTRGTTEDLRTGGSLGSANLGSEMDFIGGDFTTNTLKYKQCCTTLCIQIDSCRLQLQFQMIQWQCRCVGLYLAARDHFSMTPHPRGVGQLSRAEVMIVSLQLKISTACICLCLCLYPMVFCTVYSHFTLF